MHRLAFSVFCFSVSFTFATVIRKKVVKQQYLLHTSHNMVNFGPLAAEIGLLVWDTPANFNGFCVLAALLHGTLLVGVSQTLRRWAEGATYIRQGCHHAVGMGPHSSLFYIAVRNASTILPCDAMLPSESFSRLIHICRYLQLIADVCN